MVSYTAVKNKNQETYYKTVFSVSGVEQIASTKEEMTQAYATATPDKKQVVCTITIEE